MNSSSLSSTDTSLVEAIKDSVNSVNNDRHFNSTEELLSCKFVLANVLVNIISVI